MSTYAVIREAGPGWTDGGIAGQPAVADHAAFMNGLADEGFLLLAGPLAGSEAGRIRVLLIVDAADEQEIRNRLADDPWVESDRLIVKSIEPWNLLVGASQIARTMAM